MPQISGVRHVNPSVFGEFCFELFDLLRQSKIRGNFSLMEVGQGLTPYLLVS